jgi:P63C domain
MESLALVLESIKSEIKVNAEGKATFSIRGAARICGIDHAVLVRSFRAGDKNSSKLAAMLTAQEFNPVTFLDNGIPDTALAFIIKYYAYFAGKRCTDTAKACDMAFAAIGIRAWAREITNWQPIPSAGYLPSQIIQELPRKWQLHYDPNWQRESVRITGYRWACDIRMANFISKAVYKLLPKDVYDRLLMVNCDRKAKHHQFFTEKGDELILKQHIQRVYGIMLASESQQQFWRLMRNAFGDGIQIELELFGATEDLRRLTAS